MIGVLFLFVQTRIFCQINFAANDGFNIFLGCFFVELDGTIHSAMIGNSKMSLTKLFCLGDKFTDLGKTIQKGELGVDMEVGKLWHLFNVTTYLSSRVLTGFSSSIERELLFELSITSQNIIPKRTSFDNW